MDRNAKCSIALPRLRACRWSAVLWPRFPDTALLTSWPASPPRAGPLTTVRVVWIDGCSQPSHTFDMNKPIAPIAQRTHPRTSGAGAGTSMNTIHTVLVLRSPRSAGPHPSELFAERVLTPARSDDTDKCETHARTHCAPTYRRHHPHTVTSSAARLTAARLYPRQLPG